MVNIFKKKIQFKIKNLKKKWSIHEMDNRI